MARIKNALILAFFLIFLTESVFAADPNRILSNSEDWRDVYSVVLYGNFIGKPNTRSHVLRAALHAALDKLIGVLSTSIMHVHGIWKRKKIESGGTIANPMLKRPRLEEKTILRAIEP